MLKIPYTKTDLLKRNFRGDYIPVLDVKQHINKKEWWQSIIMAHCRIDGYLRNIYLLYINNYGEKTNTAIYRLVYELPFKKLVGHVQLAGLISKSLKKKILNFNEYRNDVAHQVLLTYNDNINEEVAKDVLCKAIEIINEVHKIAMEETRKKPRTKPKVSLLL